MITESSSVGKKISLLLVYPAGGFIVHVTLDIVFLMVQKVAKMDTIDLENDESLLFQKPPSVEA